MIVTVQNIILKSVLTTKTLSAQQTIILEAEIYSLKTSSKATDYDPFTAELNNLNLSCVSEITH